jgi:hypothetical protein
VSLVIIAVGAVGRAQEPPRPTRKPAAVPTPVVQVPPPSGALPLHLMLPQIAHPHVVGALAIPTPPAGAFGIVSSGAGGGGRFSDTATDAAAWLGSGAWGIQAFGNYGGGYFQSGNASGVAYLGYGDTGIVAYGSAGGAYFADPAASGNAHIGWGHYGILAAGNTAGGVLFSWNASGHANIGFGDYGIQAFGNAMGGYFSGNSSGYANVGISDYGIQGYGNAAGGFFKSNNASGYATVGDGNYGIKAYGTTMGGYFADPTYSGYAYVGYNEYGIAAYGNSGGGYFKSANASGYANVGAGDYGIKAYGNTMGGHFSDNASGYANVAWGDFGIWAAGNDGGGVFGDISTGLEATVAEGTYKIVGTGEVSFVQNHPTDPGAVIVYAAPEGDEVATYTRGTARLVGGEAHVPLGDTFKWVTNPDVGLTAHLTPHGEPVPLAVVSLSTEELVVRGPADAPDGLVFDYLVYGLRIGFESTAVVQEKTRESFIPSMKDHRELLAKRPDLVRYTALARYGARREAMGVTEPLKLERANALKAAIHEFDPAVDTIEAAGLPREVPASTTPPSWGATPDRIAVGPSATSQPQAAEPAVGAASQGVLPMATDQDIQARSFSSPREQLATRVAVSGTVEPGDVVVVDREHPEFFARSDRSADPTVVGVVAADAGVALGVQTGEASSSAPVALSGIARCKVDASFGPIAPGDLLVSSPTAGHAMRDSSPLPGTVVGKALESLASGRGIIRILVMPR